MPKRKINGFTPGFVEFKPPRKVGGFRKYIKAPRVGYTTVPRSRGVYAHGEMKYFDTELAKEALTASTAWTGTEHNPDTVPVAAINTLFAPTVGSAINQRIARQVKVYKLKMRGTFETPKQATQNTSEEATEVRLLIVLDTQTNATPMSGEDLMKDPTTNTAAMAINSFQSLANLGRFRVLKDKTYLIQRPTVGDGGTDFQQYGLRVP